MNFFYKKPRTPIRVKELEFQSVCHEEELPESNAALVLFFKELKRLIIAHYEYILFYEMYNVLHLLDDLNKSTNIIVYFSNIMRSFKTILSDLYDGSSVYSQVFLPLFTTGLLILSRDKIILHFFFESMTPIEGNLFLNKYLPENTSDFGHEAPRKSIADILMRSAREANLTTHVDYLISKGAFPRNGTVLQEIITQLPARSRLRQYFLKENPFLSEIMGLFFQELSDVLVSYKNRLFSVQSPDSHRAVLVLENNLLDSCPSFAKIMINMTRFMAEKTLMKKPGELFKRLFELWQAGLWILSQHASELGVFFQVLDKNPNSLFTCRLWTEYFWERKGCLRLTVGDYLMRIARETQQFSLQAMLACKGINAEDVTLLSRLKLSLCLESILQEYFRNEALKNTLAPAVSSQICCVTSFDQARDSLSTPDENLSSGKRSFSGSPWFWEDIPENDDTESETLTGDSSPSDSSGSACQSLEMPR